MEKVDPKMLAPPTLVNICIALFAYSFAAFCLYGAAHASSWWMIALYAIGFSFVGNTIFSLLHESVHRSFSRNRLINDFFGMCSAALFPTGFTLQRIFHLGHHRRNRTDVEMFDMYYPSDNLFLKRLQMYFVLLGVYWTNPPTAAAFYLVWPGFLNNKFLRGDSPIIKHMGADAMLSGLDKNVPQTRARLEIVFTIAVQVALFYFLGLSWWAWLICYWAFAVNWGGLQYADHAWSARDIRNGAWNLRVNKLVQFIFLNYHHHLAHHQHPYVPWIHLHKYVNFSDERPSFLRIYLKLWKGPTLTQEAPPKAIDPQFDKILWQ